MFEQAFASAVVWLTALLSAWMAVLPSMTVRALRVILKVHDKHKVRHEKVIAKASAVRAAANQTHLEVAYASHKNVSCTAGAALVQNPIIASRCV